MSTSGAAITVTHTSVFSDGVDGGNPCPVVLEAVDLSAAQMHAITRRYGQESVFVTSGADETVPHLRFFVPEHEMSMCVHATIAAVSLLIEHGRLHGNSATVFTAIGPVGTRWDPPSLNDCPRSISVALRDPTFSPVNPPAVAVADVLGIRMADFALDLGPIRSVSTARPKLVVPLADVQQLHDLRPDWSALWDLCDRFQTTGVYVFCRGAHPGSFHARQFPVRAGYPEDAATGLAAGALAAHLTDALPGPSGTYSYRIHQGEAMGRPSLLHASACRNGSTVAGVQVSGVAVSQGVEAAH